MYVSLKKVDNTEPYVYTNMTYKPLMPGHDLVCGVILLLGTIILSRMLLKR